MSTKITVEWPPVPNVPGYDLFENGRKVSSTAATKATFGVTAGMAVQVVAQAAPAPAPTPSPSLGTLGAWDAQSFPLDPNNTTLAAALKASAGDPYLIAGVAQASYDTSTPVVNVATQESVNPFPTPIPAGAKRGSSFDGLLQIVGPGGDTFCLSNAGMSPIVSAFGVTHVPAGAWNEPGPNSTSASRQPFGVVSVADVLSGVPKTLAFSAPNLSHAPAVYPADVSVPTNFPGDGSGGVLGMMARLPAGLTLDPGCDRLERYICGCLTHCGAVLRDIGSTWGWYGIDYINQDGNAATWQTIGVPLELLNGTLPYAHKLSAAFKAMLQHVEVVTGVKP